MPERGTTMDSKVAALKKAQNAGQVGTAFPPRFLLTAITTIATAWTAANPFGPSLDPKAQKRLRFASEYRRGSTASLFRQEWRRLRFPSV
jgi:Tetracyclin repressor-like, C-terminal domain